MTGWERHLQVARTAALAAADVVRPQFGLRKIAVYKGRNDVQLTADLAAHDTIAEHLLDAFPDYGLVSEERAWSRWPDNGHVWVVDPLDGSNNFGYGIAHCAIAITLFRGDDVVLALVCDPLLGREFFATEARPMAPVPADGATLDRATVSVVTNYSATGRDWVTGLDRSLAERCKRVISLWAPALDLALIAGGALDAMVCHDGYPLDVCGGLFLVASAGGCVVDLEGRPLAVHGSTLARPVSFVAARDAGLAAQLLELVSSST